MKKKDKDKLINEVMTKAAIGPIAIFMALGLKEHITSQILEQKTGDTYELSLKKIETKTSEQWLRELPNLTILDPDGWDRKNYEYSFFEERISFEEFNRRVTLSTCILSK